MLKTKVYKDRSIGNNFIFLIIFCNKKCEGRFISHAVHSVKSINLYLIFVDNMFENKVS